MSKILFVANNYTALAGMTFLISELKRKYSVIPTLVCESCFYETEEYEVINLTPNFKPSAIQETITSYYNQKEKRISTQILKFLISYREMGVIDKKGRGILNQTKPDAVVVYCDRMGGIVQGVIKNAKGIPVIKVSIAVSNKHRDFEIRYYNEELRVSDKRWDINRLPLLVNRNWGYTHEGETRLFYPAGYTMAGYLRRMISMHPWISGAGFSTHALAASEKQKEEILSVVKKEVITTGLVEDYYILENYAQRAQIQEQIKKKYGIKSDKIVILSMPQIAEHNMVPWEIHRDNMSFVVEKMSKIYDKFLISLHPKSKEDDYLYLNDFGSFSFLQERLRDVIVCADVLVVVSISNVVRWADILGVPKIVLEIDWLKKKFDIDIKNQIMSELQKPLDSKEKFDLKRNSIKNVPEEIIEIVKNTKLETR